MYAGVQVTFLVPWLKYVKFYALVSSNKTVVLNFSLTPLKTLNKLVRGAWHLIEVMFKGFTSRQINTRIIPKAKLEPEY